MTINIKGVIASLMLVFVLAGGVFHTANSQAGWKTKAVAAGCVINKTCRDGAKEIVTTGVEKCTKANCTGKAKAIVIKGYQWIKGYRNPHKIRFSQDSIKPIFLNGKGTVSDLTKGLKSGKIKAKDVEPIRIMKRGGHWFSIDNRRLKAFRDAGKSIRTRKATKAEIENAIKNEKFTTKNNGVSIIVRKPKNEK
jgi:hypothetical protein